VIEASNSDAVTRHALERRPAPSAHAAGMSTGLPEPRPCFLLRQRVYWEDTDASGIVYYANYLKFLERARTEWLRSLGQDQTRLAREAGIVFVVRSIATDFLRPARLDDELTVTVAEPAASASKVALSQSIECGTMRLVRAVVELACVRIHAFRPVRIPRALRELLSGCSSVQAQHE
jgi:acyl-CoA thioester hydrolase